MPKADRACKKGEHLCRYFICCLLICTKDSGFFIVNKSTYFLITSDCSICDFIHQELQQPPVYMLLRYWKSICSHFINVQYAKRCSHLQYTSAGRRRDGT